MSVIYLQCESAFSNIDIIRPWTHMVGDEDLHTLTHARRQQIRRSEGKVKYKNGSQPFAEK